MGNYDDYIEKKLELKAIAEEEAELAAAKSSRSADNEAVSAEKGSSLSYEAEKQAKREERNRQRRISELEENIAKLEEAIAEIEHEMTKPEVYQDYMALQEHESELKDKNASWEIYLANGRNWLRNNVKAHQKNFNSFQFVQI